MKVEDCMGCSDYSVIKRVTSGFNRRNKYTCGIIMKELPVMTKQNIGCPKKSVSSN